MATTSKLAGPAMIADLLPPYVACAELTHDVDEALLHTAELEAVARAVPKRRREFVAGRVCAHRALAHLGRAAQAILRGHTGEPIWPSGVVGSITHCPGYRAAVAARAADVSALGIDAEPHAPLPEGVIALVSTSRDIAEIDKLLATNNAVHWDRLLFSAKEALYKAYFPLHREKLGFKDIHVVFHAADGTFSVSLDPNVISDRQSARFAGRWLVRNGIVLATIVRNASPSHPFAASSALVTTTGSVLDRGSLL